jgi:general secretion pathway protein K
MRCHRSDAERGAALIVALLVFAVSSALVVAMYSEFTLFYQRVGNALMGEQAYAYLRGAEELASMALVRDHDQDSRRERPRDDLTEFWAQRPAPYTLDDGGWLLGELSDLQGLFNINALQPALRQGETDARDRYTAAQKQFIRLLQALEEPVISRREAMQITEAIGDWLDANSSSLPDGAEDDFYYTQTPAYRAANQSMVSVSELRIVAGVTPEIYQALQPWVTVWPATPAPLNIHTAPVMVLRSLSGDNDFDPLSREDAETLAARREEGDGFGDLDEFLAHPVFAGKTTEQLRPLLGETSNFFLLSAQVEVAERRSRLYSVLQRNNRQISALQRASGSL